MTRDRLSSLVSMICLSAVSLGALSAETTTKDAGQSSEAVTANALAITTPDASGVANPRAASSPANAPSSASANSQSPVVFYPLDKRYLRSTKRDPAVPVPLRVDEAKEAARGFSESTIHVYGDRESKPKPATVEQAIASTIAQGSPEMIAGRYYDGFYYDGTLFWAYDPISFVLKNAIEGIRRLR